MRRRRPPPPSHHPTHGLGVVDVTPVRARVQRHAQDARLLLDTMRRGGVAGHARVRPRLRPSCTSSVAADGAQQCVVGTHGCASRRIGLRRVEVAVHARQRRGEACECVPHEHGRVRGRGRLVAREGVRLEHLEHAVCGPRRAHEERDVVVGRVLWRLEGVRGRRQRRQLVARGRPSEDEAAARLGDAVLRCLQHGGPHRVAHVEHDAQAQLRGGRR